MDTAEELLKLAKEKFDELTEAEKKLFRKTAKGEIADYSATEEKDNDPTNADKWVDRRALCASRITWLCTDKLASQFVTHRGIHIKGARIDEEFDLLFAKVPLPLCFEKCKFTTDIDLRHAQIAALNMNGTHTGFLSADGLNVNGPVYLRNGFKAEGEVRLLGATVGGNLECIKSQFINKGGIALGADRLKVEGGIYLRDGLRAEGEVRLLGAEVGGSLDCGNGQFINKDGKALGGDGLKIGGSVFLSGGFKAEGEVRLFGATIGGSLYCGNGKFINEHKETLVADGLVVRGSVFMNKGFKAEGQVRLFGAKIGVNLDCMEGKFINDSGIALNADELKVLGGVYLSKGFKAEGIVSFVGATIDGYFSLRHVDSPERMTLDLDTAKIATLHDKENGWPDPRRLLLHGLEYGEISHESPRDSKTRIKWLRLQKGFWPQPYEQLAEVFRKSGDDVYVRDVLIAKNKDKARRIKLTWWQWFWYRLIGPLIGYGHRPWLAIPLALVLILFGSVFFKEGYSHGLMTPTTKSAYTHDMSGIPDPGDASRRISDVHPVFDSFVYSIDVFVPVVDLHQVKYWFPNANRGSELVPTSSAVLCTGGLLLVWLWLETACGWILTTLFLVGLTGLVRT